MHVFALGKEALSYPRAAIGIAKESGGTYTPVLRPADVMAVVDKVPVVGVDSIQVTNETTGRARFSHAWRLMVSLPRQFPLRRV